MLAICGGEQGGAAEHRTEPREGVRDSEEATGCVAGEGFVLMHSGEGFGEGLVRARSGGHPSGFVSLLSYLPPSVTPLGVMDGGFFAFGNNDRPLFNRTCVQVSLSSQGVPCGVSVARVQWRCGSRAARGVWLTR